MEDLVKLALETNRLVYIKNGRICGIVTPEYMEEVEDGKV